MIDPMQAGQGGVLGLETGPGMPDMGSVAALEPEPVDQLQSQPQLQSPLPLPPPPPDPVSLALDAVLDLPGQEAIRRVYQLATSAARAKARVSAFLDRLDARAYHDLLSKTPEARFAPELIAARRRLDELAQERRNLNLELAAGAAAEPRRRMLEVQIAACTMAMEQVAAGVLIFLALPSDAFLSQPTVPEPEPEPAAPEPNIAAEPATPQPQLQPAV
jgi:hypothetical protein